MAVPRKVDPQHKRKAPELSRFRQMQEQGREPRLPEVSHGYLLEFLLEVGPVESGGFGPVPVSHQEIRAWQDNMRRDLAPWEIAIIRRLSNEWLAASQAAEDPEALAPWSGDAPTPAEKRSVAATLRDRLSRMAK